jgi:hypothetical protein
MTTADTGSVASDGSSAGNPPDATTGADNGSAAAAGDWLAGLSGDNRKLAETKGWKSPDDVFGSYTNLEKAAGGMLKVPADDASPADWDKFYSRTGRPEKADGYALKKPEGLPAELPYDENLANGFKTWAHKAGLNGKQAQSLHDAFAGFQADIATQHMATVTKAVETTAEALVKDWGPQDSATFKTKHEMANRALKKLGLVESFKKSGIILPDGALTDPALAKAFAAIGEQMFTEDTIDGQGETGGDNPFKEPKNITAINQLVQSDPDKARALAKAAGVNPDHWVGRRRR